MKRGLLVLLFASPAAAAPWIDTPAWPAGADAVELTWVVSPARADRVPLELQVAMKSTTRTVALAPEHGSLRAYNQSVCSGAAYPLAKDEVAKVTFDEGGAGGYFVRRSADVLAVYAWSQTDGACPLPNGDVGACPRSETLVARLHVPASAKVVQRLELADAAGKRTPLACPKP